jgi:hypothetical protein
MIEGFPGEVLGRLLEGDHPVLDQLRQQVAVSRVRDVETSEFGTLIDLWVEDPAPPLEVDHRFAIDDLFGRVEGVEGEVGFQLHVVRGRIKTIEAWVSEPGWPDQPVLVESWYVAHDPDPEAAEFVRVDRRDLDFAVRGIHGDED